MNLHPNSHPILFPRVRSFASDVVDIAVQSLNFTLGRIWRKIFRPRQATSVEQLRKLRMLLHFWRFDSLGRRCGLGRRIRFAGNLEIRIGDRSAVLNNVTIVGEGSISIGKDSCIGDSCIVATHSKITIGDNVMVAAFCYIIDSDHAFDDTHLLVMQQGINVDPIVIENDVWIGAHTIILKGTHIGAGAIIAANSVIKGTIPNRAIVYGSPGRVIGYR